jgi:hypothetical protein
MAANYPRRRSDVNAEDREAQFRARAGGLPRERQEIELWSTLERWS